ncbi:MAG: DUF1559 domain-containing protein [Planctomycetia bacterium]|nr:DUF1559 domain-containing protein [Planctomycetia bacterium]
MQAAREAARRMQCANQMKNIVLAIHNYHDVHQHIVPAIYPESASGNGLIYVNTTWYHRILPFVEMSSLYDQITALPDIWRKEIYRNVGSGKFPPEATARVPVYVCPSRGEQATQHFYLGPEYKDYTRFTRWLGCYAVNLGPTDYGQGDFNAVDSTAYSTNYRPAGQPFNIGWRGTSAGYASYSNVAPNLAYAFVSFAAVLDGLSNTLFLMEVTPSRFGSSSYADVQLARGCGVNTLFPPNNEIFIDNQQEEWEANDVGRNGKALCKAVGGGNNVTNLVRQYHSSRSYHSGGVNTALGDGSVRFISDTIARETWAKLGNGGDGGSIDL